MKSRWVVALSGTVSTISLGTIFRGVGAMVSGRWQASRCGGWATSWPAWTRHSSGRGGPFRVRVHEWAGQRHRLHHPARHGHKVAPYRHGLGNSMVVMGYGLGAFFYNNVVRGVPLADASRQAASVLAARALQAAIFLSVGHLHALALVTTLFAPVAYVKDHTGTFAGALTYVPVMLAVAAFLPLAIRKPCAALEARFPYLRRPVHC